TRQDDIFRWDYKPACPVRFYGLTAWAGRRCVGMGGIAVTRDDGRAWGYVLRAPDYHAALGKGLHRRALRFLAGLKRNGVSAVYSTCDTDVPRAAEWMQRLGFEPTDERHDGLLIYKKRLV